MSLALHEARGLPSHLSLTAISLESVSTTVKVHTRHGPWNGVTTVYACDTCTGAANCGAADSGSTDALTPTVGHKLNHLWS